MNNEQFLTTQERVAELEEALFKAITHMKSMPISPVNYHAIQAAQHVLDHQVTSHVAPSFEGVLEMIAAPPLLHARLDGNLLALKTPDPGTIPQSHRESHASALRSALIRGTTITLRSRTIR